MSDNSYEPFKDPLVRFAFALMALVIIMFLAMPLLLGGW
jgi:hypothetical protein